MQLKHCLTAIQEIRYFKSMELRKFDGTKLRQLRLPRTLKDVERATDGKVSEALLSLWELGKVKQPDYERLAAVLTALNVTWEQVSTPVEYQATAKAA